MRQMTKESRMTMATRNHQLMRELEQLLHPGAVWQDSAVCAQIDMRQMTKEYRMTMATRNHQQMLALEQLMRPGRGEVWQGQAICAQTDPELFFPERGSSSRDAKKICLSCPVIDDCLEYALSHGEKFGLWGGLSERERTKMNRRTS